jgi:hypothetical protein
MDSGAAFGFSVIYFLFFFHSYGSRWTLSHAGHTENAVICSHGNRFLSVRIFSKVLKFEDFDGTNINTYTVAVAFFPVNRNLWHFYLTSA